MNVKNILCGFLLAIVSVGLSSAANANLIKNASFEDVPDASTGQGILPSHWVNIPPPTPTADTYSNDGSYGVLPGGFGNFPGVTAHDGIRWVAGWSAVGQESFGQYLDNNLVSGTTYNFSGWLHEAIRSDLSFPGGYEIYLTDTPGVQTELLGFLGSTQGESQGWVEYSFSFVASDAMAALGFLEFAPIATAGGTAYPGLDLVSLEATSSGPEPSIIGLMVAGLLGLGFSRRKKYS